MNRREFLLTTGTIVALAGCLTEEQINHSQDDNNGSSWEDVEPDERFQLVDFEVPKDNEVPIGDEISWSITIRNRSDEDATFESDVILCEGACMEAEHWQKVEEISLEIPTDETETYEFEGDSWGVLRALTYRVVKLDELFDISITGELFDLGETAESPNDIFATVEDFELQDSYTYTDSDGDEIIEESSPGSQWAFIWIKAWHESQGRTHLPRQSSFTIHHEYIGDDDLSYHYEYSPESISKEQEEYNGDEVLPDTERDGWIAFEIPNDVSLNNITIGWEETSNERYGARWIVS